MKLLKKNTNCADGLSSWSLKNSSQLWWMRRWTISPFLSVSAKKVHEVYMVLCKTIGNDEQQSCRSWLLREGFLQSVSKYFVDDWGVRAELKRQCADLKVRLQVATTVITINSMVVFRFEQVRITKRTFKGCTAMASDVSPKEENNKSN